jgi:hypothetical protein
VLLDAPERAPQNLADLAGLQMAERLPGELAALLVVGTIDSHQVRRRAEPEIGRGPLHDGD